MPSSKKKETVIVKFKFRKQKRKIIIDRKNVGNKSEYLSQLKLAGKLFISESMCHENHQLTSPVNNVKNVVLHERSQPAKIYHIIDIEKLLVVDNLDDFINNMSF